jgi:hypothetical protein
VDVLMGSIGDRDFRIRMAVLKALNRLRESAPQLSFEASAIARQIRQESRHCYELNARLHGLGSDLMPRGAASLLARTIQARLGEAEERLFRLLGLRYSHQEIYNAYLAFRRRRPGEIAAALDYLDGVVDRETKYVLLPLFDSPQRLAEGGHHVFGIQAKSAEASVGEMIRSSDAWTAACAMAAAAELKLKNLAAEIARVGQQAGPETAEVARAAVAALA